MTILFIFPQNLLAGVYFGYVCVPAISCLTIVWHIWGTGVHNVLPCPINTLHLKLVLDILLCTQTLYGWFECWNVCVQWLNCTKFYITHVGANICIHLVDIYVYTI